MADTVESLEIQITHRAGGAASAVKSLTSSLKSLSKATKPATSALSTFVSSLKRIAYYRFIRSIIKSITKAFQEGLEKAYLFSRGMTDEGGRFAKAMDSMYASSNQLKGQLGSAFISLLTAIQPIVEAIIALVVKLADALSQLFAAFTGKTYLKAEKTAASFADTMKTGAGSAKEWKNQLLGFDEINRLNEPSNGGGGGSNPLKGYKLVDTPISEFWLDFVQKIKDIYNLVKERLQPTIDRLKDAFGRLKEAWSGFVDSFDGSKVQQLIVDLLALGGEVVINGLILLADALTLVVDLLTALNTGDWSKVWFDLKQILYDVIVAWADLGAAITNIVMDVLIEVASVIDRLIGTDLAGWLQNDKDRFNEMYAAAKNSEDGLLGLKTALGLTEKSTKDTATEAGEFTTALEGLGTQSQTTETKVRGIRGAVDWVLDGFRGFGTEVAIIFNGLIQPILDFCTWIDSAIQGMAIFNSMRRFYSPNYNVYEDPTMWTSNFASGGFPDEGQLFIAREAGAEMVGSIGGRTAVANNDQIVEGIRQGVYEAVMAANSNGNRDVDVRVYLDSREIKTGQQRLARSMGVG